MLLSTNELDLTLEGPGFRPTISSEALEGLSRKAAAWTPSPTNEQHRRALYMYSKRGLLPPLMTTFDMCDTTQSCGQRDSTTVPTQALLMLNGPFVIEQSERIAARLLADDRLTTNAARVDALYRRLYSRPSGV